MDCAMHVDPVRRVAARELVEAVRTSYDVGRGREALVKLLGRWRPELEKTLPSWERKSFTSEVPSAEVPEGVLALATADERPSSDALVAPDSLGQIGPSSVPSEEKALEATDAVASISRVGAVAADALAMPLPAAKITMPPVPVYGGPVSHMPPPKEKAFRGPIAALIVFLGFTILIVGAGLLFWWLMRSPAQ
jgi:hypothetical protein